VRLRLKKAKARAAASLGVADSSLPPTFVPGPTHDRTPA